MIVERQTNPGDLQKFVVKIGDYDISNAVTDAQIFHDIFSSNWSANIIVWDTSNLLMTLPIQPGQKITVEIETQMESPGDDNKQFSFVISSIQNKTLENPGTYSYVLACVDELMIKQQTKRISKGFKDKKISDIVKNITEEFVGGECEAHETEGNYSLIIPNLSPLKSIAWLTKMAVRKNSADYFFFQTDDNKFAFKSFEEMFSSGDETLPITLTNGATHLKDENGSPLIDYMLNIGQYNFEHFDSVSNLNTGFYKNKLVSYDIVGKKWEEKIFKFGDDCPQDLEMKTWENAIFDDAENASISFKPKHPGSFDSGKGVMDEAKTWLTSRKSSVQKADQERLIVQLPGSVGVWKWIGKTIQVDLLSHEEATGEKKDKYRDGAYVVVAVAHMVSRAAYAVNLELVKKRLNEKPVSGGV